MKNSNNDVSDKTLNKILGYSKNVLNINNYIGKTWVISDSSKVLRIIFESKNRIHYSINGKGSTGTWEITGGNKLIINVNNETIWYTPIFLDDNILVLKLNSDGSLHCFLTEPNINLSLENIIHSKYLKNEEEWRHSDAYIKKITKLFLSILLYKNIKKLLLWIFFLACIGVFFREISSFILDSKSFDLDENTIPIKDSEIKSSNIDANSLKPNLLEDSLQYFDEGFAVWCPKPLEKNYDMANKIGAQAVYECMSFDGIKYTISINDISIEYLNNNKTNDQIEEEYLDYYKGKLDENDVVNEFETNGIRKYLIYYPTVPSNSNNLIIKSVVFVHEKKLFLLQVTSEKDQIGAFDIFLNSFTEKTPDLSK